jgi:hypothetical protein
MGYPLGFNHKWITLGIVTREDIQQIVERFEASDDKNEEHYRWRAFREYLAKNQDIPVETMRALYHLGDHDPDPAMGGAMMFDVVGLPGCPIDIIELAATDTERKALVKFALSQKSRRASG